MRKNFCDFGVFILGWISVGKDGRIIWPILSFAIHSDSCFVCVAGWLLHLLRSMKGGACVRLPLTKHFNNYVLSLLIACPVSVWRCGVHVRNEINGMSLRFLGLPFQATLAVAVSPPSPWQPSKQRQRIVRRWFFSLQFLSHNTSADGVSHPYSRRFRLPSLHILHMRCQFCVIRDIRRNLLFLPVWVSLRKKSIVQRDGQAQELAQAKLERNRRWFERKISTFLVQASNAPVRAANAPYGELHTSTNSRSSDHECGEHTTKRLWSGRGPGQSRSNLRRSKALRWSVRLSSVDTPSGPDATVLTCIVKTSLLACSWR